MINALSQVERALRDTLITKSEGWTFDDLTEFFGFSRPSSIARDVWRQALRCVAFGYRGTVGCTWAMIELAFRATPAASTITGMITGPHIHSIYSSMGIVNGPSFEPTDPHSFIRISGAVLDCNWIGRFVRLRYTLKDSEGGQKHISKILYTVGPQQSTTPGNYGVLYFASTPTSYWDVEAMDDPLWGEEQNSLATGDEPIVTLELLPFIMNEPSPGVYQEDVGAYVQDGQDHNNTFRSTLGKPCYIEVLLDSEAFYIPPSYLLDPEITNLITTGGESRYNPPDALPPTASINQPYDGHLMDLFGAQNEGTVTEGLGAPVLEAGDPLGAGPHPIYWIDETGLAGFSKYFDPILAAGVQIKTLLRNFCLFEGEPEEEEQ